MTFFVAYQNFFPSDRGPYSPEVAGMTLFFVPYFIKNFITTSAVSSSSFGVDTNILQAACCIRRSPVFSKVFP